MFNLAAIYLSIGHMGTLVWQCCTPDKSTHFYFIWRLIHVAGLQI